MTFRSVKCLYYEILPSNNWKKSIVEKMLGNAKIVYEIGIRSPIVMQLLKKRKMKNVRNSANDLYLNDELKGLRILMLCVKRSEN